MRRSALSCSSVGLWVVQCREAHGVRCAVCGAVRCGVWCGASAGRSIARSLDRSIACLSLGPKDVQYSALQCAVCCAGCGATVALEGSGGSWSRQRRRRPLDAAAAAAGRRRWRAGGGDGGGLPVSAVCRVLYNTTPSCPKKTSPRGLGPLAAPWGVLLLLTPPGNLVLGSQRTHKPGPTSRVARLLATVATACFSLTVLHQPELPCVACGFVCPSVGCKGTRALPDTHTYPHGMYKTRRNCGGAGSDAPARGTESRHTGHTEQNVKHRRGMGRQELTVCSWWR